jgi:hypothetical protein
MQIMSAVRYEIIGVPNLYRIKILGDMNILTQYVGW